MRDDSPREASYGRERSEERARAGDRRRTRSRSKSPTRRPVAADFYRARSPEHDDRRHSHHHHGRRRHHSRDVDGKSPQLADESRDPNKRRKQGRDHHHHHHHHRRHHHHHSTEQKEAPVEIPFNGRPLSYKHDLEAFEPLFAYYLDIQKGKDFYELDSHEARGRWKSFVNKWNRAELAEGWYDPEMFQRVVKDAPARTRSDIHEVKMRAEEEEEEEEEEVPMERDTDVIQGRWESSSGSGRNEVHREEDDRMDQDEDDDDDYLPALPPGQSAPNPDSSRHRGPGIPTTGDLALQREAAAEEHESRVADLRLARKADRAQQRERLDELVPRAEAGTRERKLEKKALVNDKMRAFREKGGDGGPAMEEVGDGELMGGGDSLDEFRRAAKEQERKKTDRELRREAEARAKAEEREERLREWREREEEKLRGLKELARARFG